MHIPHFRPVPLTTCLEASKSRAQNASATIEVLGLCTLDQPLQGHIAFLESNKLPASWKNLSDSDLPVAIICKPSISEKITSKLSIPLLLNDDPRAAFLALVPLFFDRYDFPIGIHPTAIVDQSAEIGENVSVGPFCFIGARTRIGSGSALVSHVVLYPGSAVGESCVLHSGAVIREGCQIGNHCLIQNGAVIGAEGFGYRVDRTNGIQMVEQVGAVELAAQVDVGANSCVDRATYGVTRIGFQTKLDNLVQVGHNVLVGKQSLLCAQVGIGGSSHIGDGVVLGGQAGVADHKNLTHGVRVGAQAGVITDLPEPGDYAGHPARPSREWTRQQVLQKKLPALFKNLSSKQEDRE